MRASSCWPEVPEITAGGEHGRLFLNGEYSHAITMDPILADDGGYLGSVYDEPSYFVDTAPGSVERVVDAMAGRLGR